MKNKSISVVMGGFASSLVEQLKETGIKKSICAALEKDSQAITRLSIRGLLTDSEKHKARLRLMKEIEFEAKEKLNDKNS